MAGSCETSRPPSLPLRVVPPPPPRPCFVFICARYPSLFLLRSPMRSGLKTTDTPPSDCAVQCLIVRCICCSIPLCRCSPHTQSSSLGFAPPPPPQGPPAQDLMLASVLTRGLGWRWGRRVGGGGGVGGGRGVRLGRQKCRPQRHCHGTGMRPSATRPQGPVFVWEWRRGARGGRRTSHCSLAGGAPARPGPVPQLALIADVRLQPLRDLRPVLERGEAHAQQEEGHPGV